MRERMRHMLAWPVSIVPVCVVVLAVAGCSPLDANDPYFTTPPRFYTETGRYAPVQPVAICYNKLSATPEELATLVRSACVNPRLVRQDYVGTCTWQQPVRATFVCDEVNAAIAYKNPAPQPFKGQTFGFKNLDISEQISGTPQER